jgi:hypothetical protein
VTSFALPDRAHPSRNLNPSSSLHIGVGLGIALRTVAAIAGGYALTAAATALLAALLPLVSAMQRIDATIIATMLSFAIYAGAVLWTFSTRHAWRAMLALTVILSAITLSIALPWLQGMAQ